MELSPRHARRVLELGHRHGAPLEIALRTASGEASLRCRLEGESGELLNVCLGQFPPELLLSDVIGACADVRLLLHGESYVFSTHVLDLRQEQRRTWLTLARPFCVHVENRRRLERIKPSQPTNVNLRPEGPELPNVTGFLVDIAADGLGVQLPGAAAGEGLHVGDTVVITFSLPNAGPPFELSAEICGKRELDGGQQTLVGLEFSPRGTDAQQGQARERLAATLTDMMIDFLDSEGDA